MRLRREMGDFQLTGTLVAGAEDEYNFYRFASIRTGLGMEDFVGQVVTLKVPNWDDTDGYDPKNGIGAEVCVPVVAVGVATIENVKYVTFAVNWTAIGAVDRNSDISGSSDNGCWYYNPTTGKISVFSLLSA